MGRFLDVHNRSFFNYEIDNFLLENRFIPITDPNERLICFECKYKQNGYNDYLVQIFKNELVIGYGKKPYYNLERVSLEKEDSLDLDSFIKFLDKAYMNIELSS